MFLSNEINDLSGIYFFLLFRWMYGIDRNYCCNSLFPCYSVISYENDLNKQLIFFFFYKFRVYLLM